MSDDAMKALDEIVDVLCKHLGPQVLNQDVASDIDIDRHDDFRSDMQEVAADILALPTLRAALTPPADDEVEAIRARSDAWDYALHWRSDEGDEMAAKQLEQPRTRPDMTDFQVANWVFLCGREDLRLIAAQTLAKERIRWLSAQLAKSQVDTSRLLNALDAERARRVEVEGAAIERAADVVERLSRSPDPFRTWGQIKTQILALKPATLTKD